MALSLCQCDAFGAVSYRLPSVGKASLVFCFQRFIPFFTE
jgi:hypothetical protein